MSAAKGPLRARSTEARRQPEWRAAGHRHGVKKFNLAPVAPPAVRRGLIDLVRRWRPRQCAGHRRSPPSRLSPLTCRGF